MEKLLLIKELLRNKKLVKVYGDMSVDKKRKLNKQLGNEDFIFSQNLNITFNEKGEEIWEMMFETTNPKEKMLYGW